jgi:hypothetical protein
MFAFINWSIAGLLRRVRLIGNAGLYRRPEMGYTARPHFTSDNTPSIASLWHQRRAAPSEQTGYRSWSKDHIREGNRTSGSRSSTHADAADDAPIINPLDASQVRW